MLHFDREQKVFKIGDVELGGQPGELPCVMIGSLFHEGHGIVKDRARGIFDEERARKLIRRQQKASETTGLPSMFDVVGDTEEAIRREVAFVANNTDAPIMINGPNPQVRLAGVQAARDEGVMDRSIYDSINYRADGTEAHAIKSSGIKAALIQAFNPRNPKPEGMLDVISGKDKTGLLDLAYNAGIQKPILFTPVLDLPGIGPASRGIELLKETFGLPTGTAPVGVVARYPKIWGMCRGGKDVIRASTSALCRAAGSDYIIYGSVNRARQIFPPCAVADAVIAYQARLSGIRPRSARGPLVTLFR